MKINHQINYPNFSIMKFKLFFMLISMVLCTNFAKGQYFPFWNSTTATHPDLENNPFFKIDPTPPLPFTPTTGTAIMHTFKFGENYLKPYPTVGSSYPIPPTRSVFYGGNVGVCQDINNYETLMGKWSFKGAWTKLTPTSVTIPPPVISPGINYLVDYHRWGNYSAHFGLREATTGPILIDFETQLPLPDLTRKDAVITWSYEYGQPANRLIFQSIEGTDVNGSASTNHIATEWATILANGNIGSGTPAPQAQFEIKHISEPLCMQILNLNNISSFRFYKEGKLGLGNSPTASTPPNEVLDVTGDVKFVGDKFDIKARTIFKSPENVNATKAEDDKIIDVWDKGNHNTFYISNWNGSMYYKKYNTNINPVSLVLNPDGEIVTSDAVDATQATVWLTNGNSVIASSLDFGTQSQTDIKIKTNSNLHGIINGFNSAKEGFFEYYKPVGFGGNSSIGLVVPDENFSLTLKPIGLATDGAGFLKQGSLLCVNHNNVEMMRIDDYKIDFHQQALQIWNNEMQFNVSLWAKTGNLNVDIGKSGIGTIGKFRDGWFTGTVYGTGGAWGSDKRLKENIEPIENTLEIIKKLNPVKYNFIKKPGQTEYGFIAQDLEPLLPNVVLKPNEERDLYYVQYLGIIPVLTKGMQEQQMIIDSLKQKLNMVFASGQIKDTKNINTQKEVLNQLPLLFQNHPNPFNGFTFIDYFLPPNTANAFLRVVDNNGKLIKAFPINQSGFGQIELDCTNLASGQYYYSLLVNTQLIDTKSMIIAAID